MQMCAPQYKYFFTKFEVIEPVGTCFFITTGAKQATELSSCKQDSTPNSARDPGSFALLQTRSTAAIVLATASVASQPQCPMKAAARSSALLACSTGRVASSHR